MADEGVVSRTIWVHQGEVDRVQQLGSEHAAHVDVRPTPQGLPTGALIPIIIGGAIAAVGIVEHVIDVRRGGQVIDTTSTPVKFHRSRDLKYGLILVIKKDGTIQIEVDSKELLDKVITAIQGILTEIGKESVDQAAKAITTAVGAVADVSTTEHPKELVQP